MCEKCRLGAARPCLGSIRRLDFTNRCHSRAGSRETADLRQSGLKVELQEEASGVLRLVPKRLAGR